MAPQCERAHRNGETAWHRPPIWSGGPLWDTTKARTTSKPARPAASKASACRPPRTPRRRPSRQPRSGLAPAGFPSRNPAGEGRPGARRAAPKSGERARPACWFRRPRRNELCRVGLRGRSSCPDAAPHRQELHTRRHPPAKVREGEDAFASTRDARAPRTHRALPACGRFPRNLVSPPFPYA